MKSVIILTGLISIVLSGNCQEIDREKKWDMETQFETNWEYFRMKANPLFPDIEKSLMNSIRNTFRMVFPEQMLKNGYRPDIKISKWGESKSYVPYEGTTINRLLSLHQPGFYLIEKKNGYFGVKREFMTDSVIDAMHLNVYDSIFPYDNRFLAVLQDKTKGGVYQFKFHSGNVLWGDWRDAGYIRRVDYCGYIRGVQFGIENVFLFNQEFSDKIKQFRPEYPDYVYTRNAYPSLLTRNCVIIGAPLGKEDRLIEYIYYTSLQEKTGDPDETHYYEMRYVLPTQIKSIKERRLEKRLLSDAEKEYILDIKNDMYYFIERKFVPIDEEPIIDEEPAVVD